MGGSTENRKRWWILPVFAEQGESFVEICGRTDLFEGSIIRATRRLDELMGELATAAGVIGRPRPRGEVPRERGHDPARHHVCRLALHLRAARRPSGQTAAPVS